MRIAGRRFTVMGLGRHGGGVAVTRWLAEAGARVTVTDMASAEQLAPSIASLEGVPIEHWTLGRHDPAEVESADVLVVNPAVRPDHPLLDLARQRGVPITSEIELFLEHSPARVIGVTGSNGKSTTASLLAAVLEQMGSRCWLGGNIGHSLLGELPHIQPDDLVVLELSSFQLAHLSATARFPSAVVITNCTPNHLDWHGSWANYVAAKRRLVEKLPPEGMAVLNSQDAEVWSWRHATHGRVVPAWPAEKIPTLPLPGAHNILNAGLAAAMAEALSSPHLTLALSAAGRGDSVERLNLEAAWAAFRGLPHRLELVAEIERRRFVDDSKSTTPEATLTAVRTCGEKVWLLLGGLDKGVDYQPLLRALIGRVRGIAFFGAAGPHLHAMFSDLLAAPPSALFDDLQSATQWCIRQSSAGDTVLLSPGCASSDQFRDFEHRAEVFRACVGAK